MKTKQFRADPDTGEWDLADISVRGSRREIEEVLGRLAAAREAMQRGEEADLLIVRLDAVRLSYLLREEEPEEGSC